MIHIWRVMGNLRRTMENGLGMISLSTLIPEVSSRSSPSTTDRLLLPHRKTLIMITPEITPGDTGIDLHLGQSEKGETEQKEEEEKEIGGGGEGSRGRNKED